MLEAILTGDQMGIFRFGKKREETTKADESRREFLKKAANTGIGAAGLYVAGKTLGLGQEAKADISRKDWVNFSFPPGIAIAPDIVKRGYYLCEANNTSGIASNELSGRNIYGGEFATFVERISEPAIYFIEAKYDIPLSNNSNSLHTRRPFDIEMQENNRALWEFRKGINEFFIQLRRNIPHYEQAEKHFINSIFLASYQSVEKAYNLANKFESVTFEEKKKMAEEIVSELEKMGSGKKIESPTKFENNPYYRRLTASWSSMWLTNTYWLQVKKRDDEKDDNMHLINDKVEKPLRKFIGKTRGPPFYLNKLF